MNKKDKETLKSLGYYQYSFQPYDKFCRTTEGSSPAEFFELRIRTTSQAEKDLYHGIYSAKARLQNGSVFGTGFETFFGDDIIELDKQMQEDIKNYKKSAK